MKLKLEGKVVLVTGASRGIGAATAKALAYHGATVVINYLNSKAKAEEVLAQINNYKGSGMIYQADVRDAASVNKMVEVTIKKFGIIDILVNNANINFPIKPFTELSWDDINDKISGEMMALYNCSQAVLKNMIEQKSGKLIFISSGLSRNPGKGFSAHAAAKSAVDSIAKVMAIELGPLGITVNVVGPGLVLTNATANQSKEMQAQIAAMNPLKRLGQADDIAGVVVFLASALSNYMNGEYLPVNGGSFVI